MKMPFALLILSIILSFTAQAEEQTFTANCNLNREGKIGATDYVLRKGTGEFSDSYRAIEPIRDATFTITYTPRGGRYESALEIRLDAIRIDDMSTASLSATNLLEGELPQKVGVVLGQSADLDFPTGIYCRVQTKAAPVGEKQ